MPRPYNTSLTPEQLRERARNAALSRTTIDAHARALVAQWPAATDETRAQIRAALAPVLAPASGGAAMAYDKCCSHPTPHAPHQWRDFKRTRHCPGQAPESAELDRRAEAARWAMVAEGRRPSAVPSTMPRPTDPPTGHARPENRLLAGNEAIDLLIEQGVCPADTTRVVLDLVVGHVATVYVEQVGTRGLLEVLRAITRGEIRVTHMQPAQPPPATEEPIAKGNT